MQIKYVVNDKSFDTVEEAKAYESKVKAEQETAQKREQERKELRNKMDEAWNAYVALRDEYAKKYYPAIRPSLWDMLF